MESSQNFNLPTIITVRSIFSSWSTSDALLIPFISKIYGHHQTKIQRKSKKETISKSKVNYKYPESTLNKLFLI